MGDGLRGLYDWVRGSRSCVFRYLESMPAADYTRPVPGFPLGGSIRDLQLHIAGCYFYWMGEFALQLPDRDLPAEHFPDVGSVRAAFAEVDALVARFLAHYEGRADQPIRRTVSWRPGELVVTPRWMLLHTITHEFHHKGQLVVIGRQLGYPPPETDLAFPE